MKSCNWVRWTLVAAVAALAFGQPAATAGWNNSRGGPERDGTRVGSADLRGAQVTWRQRLGGELSANALWSLSDPVAPRIAIANGGRVALKRWDDTLSWKGGLFGLSQILGEADFDNDGAADLIFGAGSQNGGSLLGYTPDGIPAFTAPHGLLGPVTTGARVVDLDGDGIVELYVAPSREGAQGRLVAAFRFPNGAGSGELMYTIDASHRDYFGGYFDVIAELDGSPGLEIMALGRNRIYLYDAATGALENESDDLGPIPFARATLRLADIDGDGTSEVFGFSDEAWSANNNRRHVTLFGFDGAKMAELWRRDVNDVVDDRVSFSDGSVTDLDGDGVLEVSFAFFTAATGTWNTEIVDAATGATLDTLPGERYQDVAAGLPGGEALLFTHEEGEPLRAYRFDRLAGGAALAATGADLRLLRCRDQRTVTAEAPRFRPCRIPIAGSATRGLVAAEYQRRSGRNTALVALDSGSPGLAESARFDGRGGFITAVIEIGGEQQAAVAIAHTDGVVLPLDSELSDLEPSPKPPFAWSGIQFGTRFSGTDVAPFPLVLRRGDTEAEHVLAIAAGSRALALDASAEPSIVGGADIAWSRLGADRMVVVDRDPAVARVALFDATDAITGVDAGSGSELWRINDAFDVRNGRILHLDPLHLVRGDTDELWFHRRDRNDGNYDLTVLDASTGAELISVPTLDVNDSGWKRLSRSVWDGEPAALSGRVGEVWRFDAAGGVAETFAVDTGNLAIPVPRSGADPLLLVNGRNTLSVFDPETGANLWSMDNPNAGSARLGAVLNVGGANKYAAGRVSSPTFRVIDLSTGQFDFEANLIGGEARELAATVPQPPPVLSNVTAITDLTGDGEPAYLVGSSDGFIYAISATTFELFWSLDVEAPVGEIVPADWDGDGRLELAVSTADGAILGIDSFSGAAPEWVNDTDGVVVDDIDELATRFTLYARWARVEGATSYQVAVFTNDGTPVTSGFGSVGNATETAIDNLLLDAGTRYVVSVRAVSALGISSDTASDGVTVLPFTGSDGGGCCQVTGDRDRLPGAVLLAALCFVIAFRRRSGPLPT